MYPSDQLVQYFFFLCMQDLMKILEEKDWNTEEAVVLLTEKKVQQKMEVKKKNKKEKCMFFIQLVYIRGWLHVANFYTDAKIILHLSYLLVCRDLI